jgi:glycosyltransferase involved in cell wall biosynthesis/2-polyprenyl-3-methyl-5-hydroxy-6-metoxy-1,4-benzoquinol methylase
MPTPLHWTPELITRFWNGVGELPSLEHVSFANLASERLVELMRDFLKPDMTCLDYGGGSGHLVKALIANGQRVAVFEPSDARAHAVEEKFKDEPNFLGVHGPLSSEAFDAVLCMEVIEHILDGDLAEFLHRMNTHVRLGGRILLTTPYNERLGESEVYCPQCDSVFHRWQHVRNFNATSLRAMLGVAGFEPDEIALVGFGDADALGAFISSRGSGEWKAYHRETSGDIFANVGAADHIFFAGRKTRAPEVTEVAASLARLRNRRRAWLAPDQPTLAIAPAVKAAGLRAEADIYTPETQDDETGWRYARARVHADGSLQKAPPNGVVAATAVFDGEMEDLLASPSEAQIRQAHDIHIRDGATWRRLARNSLPRPAAPVTPSGIAAARDKFWTAVAPHLFRWPLGRRQQAHFDRAEVRLQELLSDTEDFPFRTTHYVPGRVALGISSLSSGGAERQTVYVAAGLRARGHDDVHLVVDHLRDSAAHAFYLAKAAESARTIREVGNEDFTQMPWFVRQPDFWRILGGYVAHRTLNTARHFHELAPEVVQTSLDWTNITMGLAAVMAGVPRVLVSGRNLSPTHFGFFQWFMYPAYRALAAQPNVTLFNNSESGARDYEDWLRLPRGTIKVVRNGIDTEAFSPPPIKTRARARAHFKLSSEARVVAGAFRLSPEKRPLLWLKTAAALVRRVPNVEFLLLGTGPMQMQAQMYAYKLGIGDRVRFAGVAKDIRFAFAAADAVLLTSLQEGTPNVLIEAQAMGVPVVTTTAFGAAETVANGATGLVVPQASPSALADALGSILNTPEIAQRFSVAGPNWTAKRFGMERMVDDVLALHAATGAPT